MAQVNTPQPMAAREVLWTYQGSMEDTTEHEFFTALAPMVAEEIKQRLSTDGAKAWVGRQLYLHIGSYTIQARLTNIEPLLATVFDSNTRIITRYQAKTPNSEQELSTFVAEIIRYPNQQQKATFESLVGLDDIKQDLFRKLALLIGPQYIDDWLRRSYPQREPQLLRQILGDRYPLVILEGEVGSGKTALARSIGDRLARRMNTDLALFVVNAQVRGGGHVGELTQNIARAFTEAERCQEREQIPVLILIDEADALAQSRGQNQTHHEDDAGVNALIQRIDRLRGRPLGVLFATNLLQSLDAAIMRRAIAVYHFERPQPAQREDLLRRLLTNVPISEAGMAELVKLTEPRVLPGSNYSMRRHRYTCSDLVQRIIPCAVEEALYAQEPLALPHLIHACQITAPTPEMSQHNKESSESASPRAPATDRRQPARKSHQRSYGHRLYRAVEE